MAVSESPNTSSEIGTHAAEGRVWRPRNTDLRQVLTVSLIPIASPSMRPRAADTEKPRAMRTREALTLGHSEPSAASSTRRLPTWTGDGKA
jgi:hypothetical protein